MNGAGSGARHAGCRHHRSPQFFRTREGLQSGLSPRHQVDRRCRSCTWLDPLDEERHHELCLLAQNEAGYRQPDAAAVALLISRVSIWGDLESGLTGFAITLRDSSLCLAGGRAISVRRLLHGRDSDAHAASPDGSSGFPMRFYLETTAHWSCR